MLPEPAFGKEAWPSFEAGKDTPVQWPPLKRTPWHRRIWRRAKQGMSSSVRPLVAIAVIGAIGYLVYTRHLISNLPSVVETPTIVEDLLSGNPLWGRPVRAPNGSAWPKESGYIAGYPRLDVGGIANVVIDNTGGRNDLFAKLIDRDQHPPKSVCVVYLRAREHVTLARVLPALYDVRYLNLDSGLIRQSPTFEVARTLSANGERYMGWTIPVYTTVKGSIHHREISQREF